MRKIILSSIMLLTVILAQGQTKIAPTLKKGMVKTYQTTVEYQIPGQSKITTTSDETFTVADVTDKGCVINLVSSNFKSDAAEGNIAGQIMTAAGSLMSDVTIVIDADKDGKALRIANYAEVQKQLDKRSEELADKILASVPAAAGALPKDNLKSMILESLSEDKLLKGLQNADCPLTLNGKTLATGTEELFVNKKDMKMKRLYFVMGKTITCNAVSAMTTEEMKELIIAKIEEAMPEQAEMVKQNIDQLVASGMLKLDMQENASYQLADDGWMKSIKVEDTADTMGQKMVVTTTYTLK